jgi:uncharacterized protein YbbC (DUF1343 family)
LLSLESLLAYVGTCLFEAVNVSEGRGTDHPFELIGAAWLDNTRVLEMLKSVPLRGVRFEAEQFTPVQKPYHGQPPELAGESLKGVRLYITDRDAFEPYKTGVALLWAVHALHRDKLVWNDAALDRLSATPRLKEMLVSGKTPQEIFAAWDAEVETFRKMSAKYFMYPMSR